MAIFGTDHLAALVAVALAAVLVVKRPSGIPRLRCLALLLIAALAANPVSAATVCMPHKNMIEFLHEKYQEISVGLGLTARGDVIEVLSSAAGGFSVILTKPNGASCIVVSGEAWHSLPRFDLSADEPG